MFGALLEAWDLLFTVSHLTAIAGGVALGVVVGAIPGLTGTLAVALALPFSLSLTPITAILLLLGIYRGAIYGGSIPAILINTPGTPSAACTVLDGYPLACRNQARKALTMALYASCIADLISTLVLILSAGALASVALALGPPEFFVLVAFSLTVVVRVSGASRLRGLLAALLGLLLATVGQDLVYGGARFSAAAPELMAGVGLIPLLTGLYVLTEVIERVVADHGQPSEMRTRALGEGVSVTELLAMLPTILRSSFIGVLMGIIPGIGAAPAAFLSYSEARRRAATPDVFGSGALAGVAASEAGNNGVCSATLIPLLALGVPGDAITALVLGALMVHGLSPGPLLFEQHLPLVYALFIGLLFSSLALLLAGRVAISLFARLVRTPGPLLFPLIAVLCGFGVYGLNGSVFDLSVMVVAAIAGVAMRRLALPRAPLMIAFILGPLLEDNLRRSLLLSQGDPIILLHSPFCWVVVILTVLSLLVAGRSGRYSKTRA